MADYDPAKAAATGAALLDGQEPGWWQRIHPKTLEMADPCCCIIGQVYGNWFDAPRSVKPPGNEDAQVERGFELPYDIRTNDNQPTTKETAWDALKAAWVAEVGKRRAAAGQDSNSLSP